MLDSLARILSEKSEKRSRYFVRKRSRQRAIAIAIATLLTLLIPFLPTYVFIFNSCFFSPCQHLRTEIRWSGRGPLPSRTRFWRRGRSKWEEEREEEEEEEKEKEEEVEEEEVEEEEEHKQHKQQQQQQQEEEEEGAIAAAAKKKGSRGRPKGRKVMRQGPARKESQVKLKRRKEKVECQLPPRLPRRCGRGSCRAWCAEGLGFWVYNLGFRLGLGLRG